MKKTIIILMIIILMLLSGCAPFVMSMADTVSNTDAEPVHLRTAKPIPEPGFETYSHVDHSNVDEILKLTNEQRAAQGLPEVSLSPTLNKIAELRAADMAEKGYFEHTSPTGQTAFSLLQEYQILYFNASENIGRGTVSCERMMQTWMDSPPHREVILSKVYHQLGVGIVQAGSGELYWVQVFSN